MRFSSTYCCSTLSIRATRSGDSVPGPAAGAATANMTARATEESVLMGQMVGCAHEPGKGSVVLVVLRPGGHVGVCRRILGHLLAPLDRARYVLVGAAYGDLRVRRP